MGLTFIAKSGIIYPHMIATQRQQNILDTLAKKDFLAINQMAKKLDVSEATVRRDFEMLARLGLAARVRGGIGKVVIHRSKNSFNRRQNILTEEKERIGREAASLVKDGDTIIMDGGTTTNSMSKFIAHKNIQVITNSITVVDYLSDFSNIDVIVTGGYLYRSSKVLLGQPAIETLKNYNATKTFVSAGGLTLEGIGHSNSLVVETEKMMISRGKEVVLLIDHTKFGATAAVNVCPWTKFKTVVSDRKPQQPFKDFFKKKKINYIVAK